MIPYSILFFHRKGGSTYRDYIDTGVLSHFVQSSVHGLLQIMERGHIGLGHHGIIHIGNQVNAAFLLYQSQSGRFMTSQFKVLMNRLDPVIRGIIFLNPVTEDGA